jgi:ergothioneine biosynthesis protein EgtB
MQTAGSSVAASVDRAAALAWYRRNRERSQTLFDLLSPEAYYSRPIALRHPIVFYEGHLAAFAVNTIVKKALGRPGIDERLETLFARGIDPEDERAAAERTIARWPERAAVQAFANAADALVIDVLINADLSGRSPTGVSPVEAVFTVLEHEAMHQETLLYIWQRLRYEHKRRPDAGRPIVSDARPEQRRVRVPAGRATLGADRGAIAFGWDNEFPALAVDVPAFEIDAHDVTNGAYLEFVEAGGYATPEYWSAEAFAWLRAEGHRWPLFWEREGDRWFWRGMFERVPLPLAWPVYVSHAEAAAFARWRGSRLPGEAEFHRAAYGTPDGHERAQPWGEEPADPARGNFDFVHWDPVPAGSFPAGRSAWGIEDLVGNGWEWTATVFDGFPGFRPMPSYPEYSADFFDGQHFVMKGASPSTARELVRRSFRNWFRPLYPYVFATFRTCD